jgi:spermidine/putrescine transport system permease protein
VQRRVLSFFGRRRTWSLPYVLFLFVFVLVPLVLIVVFAFTGEEGGFTFGNFRKFLMHPEALKILIYSIGVAMITTIFCLLFGYPAAYLLSRMRSRSAGLLVMLFILPMWINFLIRTLATVALFGFMRLPLGEGALLFGMVYNFLPFMIYPIYNILQKTDPNLIEAAQDLGANPRQVFFRTILPLSVPGIASGVMMVFMPVISTFAIAELLTINNIKLFGTTLQENIYNGMWNYGAALSLVMLVLIGVISLFTNQGTTKAAEEGGLI